MNSVIEKLRSPRRGIKRLQRAVRQVQRRLAPPALILLYHRIAEVGSDPWSLCVTPQHFAEHLEVLQAHTHPMRLQQLTQHLQDGRLPYRSVVITFDDGYADNLHTAKPLLEHYGIPATVFITSGYLGHKREFWWDELERLILQPRRLPERLELSINGHTYQWELGEAAYYSDDDYQDLCCWKIEYEDAPGPRQSLYCSLYQVLHLLPEHEQRKALDELRVWADADSSSRPSHQILTPEEVVALGHGDLIEVGSHTVTHPFLSTLCAADQQHELQHSKADLEELLSRPVTSFSYPNGSYSAATIAAVQEAGFTCACSSMAKLVWQETDCFQLPRVVVEDWDGEMFANWLENWFCS